MLRRGLGTGDEPIRREGKWIRARQQQSSRPEETVPLLDLLKKYYTQAGDQDDLISIGTIGLIKGIATFNPDKKVRLATYASRCVENAILSLRIQLKQGWLKCSQVAVIGASCPTLADVWG